MKCSSYKIRDKTKEEYILKIFDSALSLLEIEDLLEEKIALEYTSSVKKGITEYFMMNRVNLNYEDYRYLLFKLKGLTRYENNVDIMGRYKLSIIIAMVFTIRNHQEEGTYEKLKERFLRLPQHQLRQYLTICKEAFDEYAIHSFGLNLDSFDGMYEALSMHAGVNQEYVVSYVG